MSHFVGLVFGSCVEENLERYDENLEVESYVRYTKEEAIEEAKADQRSHYILVSKRLGENPKLDDWSLKIAKLGLEISDEQAWELAKDWGYEVDEDENLLTTYNPESKWDWYQLGGRWSGYLPLKELDDEGKCYLSDDTTVGEIDWDEFFNKEGAPFCFIDEDGEWYELGGMGWFGIVSDEKDKLSWEQQFQEYIKTLDDNVEVYAIDFHI